MAMEGKVLVFSGHGEWKPSDGYTEVPKGSEMLFYTDNMRNLMDSLGGLIDFAASSTDLPEPEQTVGEFRNVPNMRLYPPSSLSIFTRLSGDESEIFMYPGDLEDSRKKYVQVFSTEGEGVTIKQLFEAQAALFEGRTILWSACRTIGLNETNHEAVRGSPGKASDVGPFLTKYVNAAHVAYFTDYFQNSELGLKHLSILSDRSLENMGVPANRFRDFHNEAKALFGDSYAVNTGQQREDPVIQELCVAAGFPAEAAKLQNKGCNVYVIAQCTAGTLVRAGVSSRTIATAILNEAVAWVRKNQRQAVDTSWANH